MKQITPEYEAHNASGSTTVCTCWKLTRTDGRIFGFTDHTRSLTFDGVGYLPSTGYVPTSVETTSKLNVDNLEVNAILDSAGITDADILAGVWDMALVEIFQLNYMDLTMGKMMLRKGWVGNIKPGKNTFVAEIRGMMQPLQQSIGRVTRAACDAVLGDTRCKVNMAAFTFPGVVTSTNNTERQFTDSGIVASDGYFNEGILEWTSGLNDGYFMEVKYQLGGAVELQQPMPFVIQSGDTYVLKAGCDHLIGTCFTKFNNVVNFRGFPHIPGNDLMTSGA